MLSNIRRYDNFIFTDYNADRDAKVNVCSLAIVLFFILYLNGQQLTDTKHTGLYIFS